MNKKVWCTIFLTGSRCRGRWIFESHECLNILRELGLNFFVCDWKVWDPFKRNCHKLQAYGRAHRTTTVIRLTVCFRLFQSAIDTIHYALPFLRLNGDEARFSGHQLQTENGRGSCGGHTAEELYFLAGYSSAIRSHGQRIARRKSHCIYQ